MPLSMTKIDVELRIRGVTVNRRLFLLSDQPVWFKTYTIRNPRYMSSFSFLKLMNQLLTVQICQARNLTDADLLLWDENKVSPYRWTDAAF